MNKTLRDLFDEAKANEIENLANRNDAPDVSADILSSIKEKVYAKIGITNPKKRPFIYRWQSYVAAAVCIALITGAIMAIYRKKGPESDLLPHTPILFDATKSPEEITGSNLEFIVGSSASVNSGQSSAPPSFDFDTTDFEFIVKAKVTQNYPALYYKLNASSEYTSRAYRLIQMECLEVIHGQDVPKYFLYLIPNSLFVDMSAYDSLLISMSQLGTDNYVLKNGTEQQMETFSMPIFADYQNHPELGNIIAFSDGVFDESLWQNKNWLYGYQFGRHLLDNPDIRELVVARGDSESVVISKINRRIKEGKSPALVTLDFSTQAAKDAVEYVQPFANGVFSQTRNGQDLIFTRFINGCQTEETIIIDLQTEEVTYSEVRYTKEDMAKIENISLHLSEKAKEYANQTPIPPHTDPQGKELLSLNLYAWYAKVDGRLYGVVKTAWRHMDEGDRSLQYYDEAYILYDMSAATAQRISRDELTSLLGPRNVSKQEFGVGIEIPMC